jgi:hypothetical protein
MSAAPKIEYLRPMILGEFVEVRLLPPTSNYLRKVR